MDQVTQQNSALVEENAATAKSLEQQAAAMSEQVGTFRLAANDTVAPVQRTPAAAPARAAAPKPRPAAAKLPATKLPAVKQPAVKLPAVKQPVARQPAPVQGSNGAHRGPVGRMQSALATALKADEDWKEF